MGQEAGAHRTSVIDILGQQNAIGQGTATRLDGKMRRAFVPW